MAGIWGYNSRMLTVISNGKIALIALGVLVSGSAAWLALMWWIGNDFDEYMKVYRKTYYGDENYGQKPKS